MSRKIDATEKVEKLQVRSIVQPRKAPQVVRVRLCEIPPRQEVYRVRVLNTKTS